MGAVGAWLGRHGLTIEHAVLFVCVCVFLSGRIVLVMIACFILRVRMRFELSAGFFEDFIFGINVHIDIRHPSIFRGCAVHPLRVLLFACNIPITSVRRTPESDGKRKI